jgi:hypothetical protein
VNKEEQDKFLQRCLKAFELADRVFLIYEPTAYPATHSAYPKIFELAYQEIEKTEEE